MDDVNISFLRTLIKPMVHKAHIPMLKIRISQSKQINAWTNYKRYEIVITQEALDTLPINGLIGMLSHEIGHFYIRKYMPHDFFYINPFFIIDSLLTIFLTLLFGYTLPSVSANILSCIVVALWLCIATYDKCNIEKMNELEADKIGTKICGNRDVLDMLDFFYTKCQPIHSYQYTKIYKLFFDSHPSTSYRIKYISHVLTAL